MKRCPSCARTFEDESLGFCPHDGAGLQRDTPSAPAGLQATMMATPSSLGGSSYPPPPPSQGPGSGSFNPPPNQSWATPSKPNIAAPPKSGGMNKKLIFGGIGCVVLIGIVMIVGLIFFVAFSGPASKMNPYTGDLKELAPETVGIYKRVDVDILSSRDKEDFGAVNDAVGVAYKDSGDAKIEMFVGNYATAKAAEAGLQSFKDKQISKGFKSDSTGSKKIGWRTVGTRFVLTKGDAIGKSIDSSLPDGARVVLVQTGDPEKIKKVRFTGWTNGSVVFVMAAEEDKGAKFEEALDAAVK